ncbi:MAG: NAD-glutamate dehydrogenase domain-containing protein, partial [Pseudomonadota bacterium]
FSPYFGDAALVRVHYIIGIDTDAPEGPGVVELTRKIREVTRNWEDDLLDTMRRANQGSLSTKLFSKYIKSFDIAYQERNSAEQAVSDIDAIEKLGDQDIDLSVYRSPDEPDSSLHIRLFSRNLDFQLSDLIPTMENLGLRAITEKNYELQNQDTFGRIAINDFYVEDQFRRTIDLEAVSDNLREAFLAVLNKNAEDDSFNALVVTAGITWREASVLRAAAKHALQTGFSASQAYIAETLSKHANITKMLVDMFHARFDPVAFDEVKDREQAENAKSDEIVESLKDVSSLDEDKIIRRYVNFIKATTRTNFYQVNDDNRPKAYLSLKIDTKKLQDVPDPKPFREIFVASPTVDGVHLRFGAVARGGLRWSDRREDFRTEVLGLVKAQRVKNAVIVPAGAKGCFYPKNIPIDGDRAAVYEAGRTAYIEFVKGLLDVTDNIVEGDTIPPKNVVCWDAPDPYLVVAADKGTASFSDTANGVSETYGFWLGDAFASGGSEGYDHKVMGITARGGWEAVKRHFREIGKDIQTEEFSVVGVGDMSGDVFGNGMLLSTKIQLIAAFDHRDIFIDPSPNADASFKERQRLFDTPRSTWQDYDASLISKGGGVFSRSLKSIPITPEMQTAFDTNATALTPNELIKAILKAKVELLWMGGIGTYFKDKNEENWRVGDRANDPVRIDADEMHVLVVGEGANLGLTQRA